MNELRQREPRVPVFISYFVEGTDMTDHSFTSPEEYFRLAISSRVTDRSSTANAELLPCPFCGSRNLKGGGDDKVVGIRCLDCEATGPNHYGKTEWNTRDRMKTSTVTEFTNEVGNAIRITIEGPTSKSTNDLTPLETSKLNEVLTSHLADPRHALRQAVALEIWHRFANDSVEEWEHETHKAEYLLCADAILALCQPGIPAQSTRVSAFETCLMIVAEECVLDAAPDDSEYERGIHDIGMSIYDRIKCAQRNPDAPAQSAPEPAAREIDEILNQLEDHSPNWVAKIRAYISTLRGAQAQQTQWRTDFENAPSPCIGWCTPPAGDDVRQIWRHPFIKDGWSAHGTQQTVKAWQPLPSLPSTELAPPAPESSR